MPKWILRQSRDYNLEVEAPNEEEALKIGEATPLEEWGLSYSDIEVDET